MTDAKEKYFRLHAKMSQFATTFQFPDIDILEVKVPESYRMRFADVTIRCSRSQSLRFDTLSQINLQAGRRAESVAGGNFAGTLG